MLTYDSLVEQAKITGMPQTKIRGILREYLQILILKEIYRDKEGKNLYFTGGTYLRLVCNLKRFSEDLDFYTNSITKDKFEKILTRVKQELERIGIESKLTFSHWQSMYVAKLVFPALEKRYNVVSKYSRKQGIIIKIEANKSRRKIKNETFLISGFGDFFPAVCVERGTLFADKIDALTNKNRGRHLYDIIFMLSNKYPIDKAVLASLGIKKDSLKVITDRINSLSKTVLKNQAESLRPFLFDEKEADLLINAQDLMPSLIERYISS